MAKPDDTEESSRSFSSSDSLEDQAASSEDQLQQQLRQESSVSNLNPHSQSPQTTAMGQDRQTPTPQPPPTPTTACCCLERLQDANRELHKKGLCMFLLIAVVVFLILDSIRFCIIPGLLSGFLEWVEHNPTPGIFAFTTVFLLATILLIPGAILTLGAGYVFANAFGMYKGVLLGSISTFVGAVAGSLASFFLGRYLLRNWVNRMSAKYEMFEALDSALEEKGLRIMVLLRLSPIIPYNVVNYIAGVTGVTLFEYTLSLLALLPGTVLYVFLGASAGSLASTNENGTGSTYTTIVIVTSVVFGIAAIALTSYYSKRELNKITERKRRHASRTEVFTTQDFESSSSSSSSSASSTSLRPEEGEADGGDEEEANHSTAIASAEEGGAARKFGR